MNRVHWPSLIITLVFLLISLWLVTQMPAGLDDFCVARGKEWFSDLRRCL